MSTRSDLSYKKNWDETKRRFCAWWNREDMDRPVLFINVRNDLGPQERLLSYNSPEDKWLNTDKMLNNAECIFANSLFLAETFPYTTAYLGPGSVGVFLGAEPNFTNDTIWYKPCFDSIHEAKINFNPHNKWWRWTLDFTEKAVERAQGRYLVAMTDLIENLDTLAALLGTEPLLRYLVDSPNEIHRLQKELLLVWFKFFNELYDRIKDNDGGNAFMVFGLWAPGRMAKLQCDFSNMISEKMFEEFVMPYLRKQCNELDYSLYHIDGPGAVRYLDLLLSIDSLDVIQFTPGAGQPDGGDSCWDMIYKRTLEAGKGINVGMSIDKIELFIEKFGKKGVHIRTGAESKEQALDLIDRSYNW